MSTSQCLLIVVIAQLPLFFMVFTEKVYPPGSTNSPTK